jgi:hypothetical protein
MCLRVSLQQSGQAVGRVAVLGCACHTKALLYTPAKGRGSSGDSGEPVLLVHGFGGN